MARKGIIAAVVVGGAALLSAAAIFGYQALQGNTTEAQAKIAGVSGPLSKLRPSNNIADVQDNLAFAIEQSEDAVGWIEVPGTDINSLIMQGDDNYYYERRDEDGNQDVYGCYFADYECRLGGRDDFLQNTIIYGHGNATDDPNGKRFSQLFRFVDPEFAKSNPYIHVTTQQGKFTFQIFAAFYTDISFDYIKVHISDEEKLELAKEAASLSIYDYGLELQKEDRLLTLSTCSTKYSSDGDHRFVIMARLCPEGTIEKETVDLTVK